MQELVKITEQDGRQVVSARELHTFLEVPTHFTDWAKRMFEYGFSEQVDFIPILGESTGGRPGTDYVLTLDCAKEICMIQRTEKGKQARLYFIEMEKIARNPTKAMTRKEIAQMLLDAENEIERLQVRADLQAKQLQISAPKVQYHDKVLQSSSLIPINLIAKELGMSAVTLNKKLHQLGIQYQSGGAWVLYSKYQEQGWTGVRTHSYVDSDGRERTVQHTYWTEKGRQYIHTVLNQQMQSTPSK